VKGDECLKRDMDLIRYILLEIEEKESTTSWTTLSLEGYSDEQVNYHLDLLDQVGFLEVKKLINERHMVRNLTMRGHDFLDNAKNESVWNKTKAVIKDHGGSASMQVILEVLKATALKHFNLN
jgi:Hypothetical protein (DUF2513)